MFRDDWILILKVEKGRLQEDKIIECFDEKDWVFVVVEDKLKIRSYSKLIANIGSKITSEKKQRIQTSKSSKSYLP
jgi:sensor histidine kinase regulating citrate/malate metabolism